MAGVSKVFFMRANAFELLASKIILGALDA
jgi:hypothetical protein